MSFPSPQMSERDSLLQSWQYTAHTDFLSYAHWESITPTSNELRDVDGNPATVIITGQAVTHKLSVDPLGNFQSYEERQQKYTQDSDTRQPRDSMNCVNAKLVVVLRRPAAPAWKTDFDTAISRLDKLEEIVAKDDAPRQWFVDKTQTPPFLRLSFPLWEKKKYRKNPDTFLDQDLQEEDDLLRELREEHSTRGSVGPYYMSTMPLIATPLANQTAKYCSYIPDTYVDAYRSTSKTHHICLAPIFFPNGKRVEPDEFLIRLDNALLEIMFTLRHYYYPATKKSNTTSKGWFNNRTASNTYTATIEQIKILHINPVIRSPIREPTMKSIQHTPPSQKGKGSTDQTRKRITLLPPTDGSPSNLKKKRVEVSSTSSTLDDLSVSTSKAKKSRLTSPIDNDFNNDHNRDDEESDTSS